MLTEAGYVGEDVEHIIEAAPSADDNVQRAQRGIVYIDEIDKISESRYNPSITRARVGRGRGAGAAQDHGGTTASVPPEDGRKYPQQEVLQVDTATSVRVWGCLHWAREDHPACSRSG